MTHALFVTSSGTEIGKTFIAAMLIRQLRAAGKSVEAFKPIVSGMNEGPLAESDPGLLLSALGRQVTQSAVDAIAPWQFAEPLSPDMAAAREGREIAFGALTDFCRTRITESRADVLIIEGAGGILAPVGRDHLVADLIGDLGLASILVIGSYLGTLSHSLSAIEAMAARGLAVSGIVISASPVSPVPIAETAAVLARHTLLRPIVTVPRIDTEPSSAGDLPDLTRLVMT